MVCLGIVSPMYPMMGLQIAKANEAQVKHSDARWIEKSNSPIILRQEAARQHTAAHSSQRQGTHAGNNAVVL
jgi:hypothetical protein